MNRSLRAVVVTAGIVGGGLLLGTAPVSADAEEHSPEPAAGCQAAFDHALEHLITTPAYTPLKNAC